MDGENQNSSEKFGTQNADAFGAPVQPPTHPANSTVSSDPPADNKIISSANLTPPTPLSAPLPTDPLHPIQTVGTGSGDVVVGEGRKSSKKWLVVIGVIVGVVMILMFTTLGRGNASNDTMGLLQKNSETIEIVENFFESVYFGNITTSVIMDGATHKQLNREIPAFVEFQTDFAKINAEKVDIDVRSDIITLQEIFAQQAENFTQSLAFYNALYASYNDDGSSTLDGYFDDENYNVATIAERLANFIEDKKQLLIDAKTNQCSLVVKKNVTDFCVQLADRYNELVDELGESSAIPQGIFFAYDSEPDYSDDRLVMPRINRVIEELKK